ncbi:MAG: DUF1674 domain-containing protein [Geminicoccales bacterium]
MVDERQDQPTAPKAEKQSSDPSSPDTSVPPRVTDAVKEIGGQKGPEPTRYGDWEKGGRCTDF